MLQMNQRLNPLLLFIVVLFIGTSHSWNTCSDDILQFGLHRFNITYFKDTIVSEGQYSFRFCNPIPKPCGYYKNKFNGCDQETCLGVASRSDNIEMIYVNGKIGLSVTHKNGDEFYDGCFKKKENELKLEYICDKNSITNPTNITVIKPQCETNQIQTIIRMYHKDACPIDECGKSCSNTVDNCITCPNECLSCSFSGFALLQHIVGDDNSKGYQLSKPVVGNFLNNTDLPVVSYLMTSFMSNQNTSTYTFRVRGGNTTAQVLVNYKTVIKVFEQPEFEVESRPIKIRNKDPLLIYVRVKSSSGYLEKSFELDWDIGRGFEPIKGVFYSKHVCDDGLLDITEDPNECDMYGLKVVPISDDLFDEE